MIVIIMIIGWLLLIDTLTGLDNYEIKDRILIVKRRLLKPKYKIPVDDIIKVYPTNVPDELVTMGARRNGFNWAFEYIQIEFWQNKEWKSTYIDSSCVNVFTKQIELIRSNNTITTFEKFSIKPILQRLFIYFLVTMTTTAIIDFIYMHVFNYKFIIVWFIVPIIQFTIVRKKITKFVNILGDDYINKIQHAN